MPSVTPPSCTHDLGPGTTVCLRCRQEQREIVNARQLRLLGRGGAALVTLIVMVVAGSRAVSAWRGASQPAHVLASTTSTSDVQLQGEPAPAASTAAVPAAAEVHAPAASVATDRPPLTIVIRTGDTSLADSVIAQRAGDSVFVDFDTETGRTRRPEKFERMVRRTLPAIYGRGMDSVLAAIPEGGIVAGGDLLTDLPARGIRLPLSGGWTLRVMPETRRGEDGPLVKSYRARVVKSGS